MNRYGVNPSLDDITVLIPHLRGNSQAYLDRAISSLPQGMNYLLLENDMGELAEALNAGLAAVETGWVFIFSDDDVLVESCIEDLAGVAFDADVVYPSMILASEDLSTHLGEHPAWPFCGNRLQQMNFVPGIFLARTDTVREAGYRHMNALEDWDIHVRMFRAGARYKPCPDAKVLYRQRDTSRNKGLTRESIKFWREQWVEPRPKTVAHFYHQGSAPGAYLRCQLPAKHLPGICNNDFWYLQNEDGVIRDSDIEADTVVFQWPGDQARALALVSMKANGIKVWVEVDDNYLTWEEKFMRKVGWGVEMNESTYSTAQHRWICKHADGIIVTTNHLRDIYRDVNPNVVVAPNCVDTDDWAPFADARKLDDTDWHVGWFASPSHEGDQKLIWHAANWASKQENVKVSVMGFNPKWKFPHVRLPWTNDIAMYRLLLHSLDVGWCPVSPTNQGLGRSDIKASELAMAGALPILTDLPPYDDWVHGETCLKAASPQQFLEHTRWALTNRDEARAIANNAKEWVLSNRNIRRQIEIWRDAFR